MAPFGTTPAWTPACSATSLHRRHGAAAIVPTVMLLLGAATCDDAGVQHIAAQHSTRANWTVHQNSDVANPGHADVGSAPAQSLAACAAMCLAHQNCASASWNGPSSHYHDNNCNLHCGGRLVPSHGETAVIVRDVGSGEQLCSEAPPPAPPPPPPPFVQLPARWLERQAAGNLVWAVTPAVGPVPGPLPNFGNGYMAAQFTQAAGTMFIAGVMSGALPPPFGPEKGGGVSQRAGVPLLLGRISDAGWRQQALANDLEQAFVEELYTNSAGAKVTLRHYAHRDSMHLLITDIFVNNTGIDDASAVVSARYNWSSPAGAAVSFAQSGSAPPGATCQVGRTAVAETGADRVTIAICYTADELQVSTEAGGGRGSLLTAIFTSLESVDPLADAIAAWKSHHGAAAALLGTHVAAQEALWESRIEVGGNLELALSVNSSLYGIMISVRDELNFSTSPGGLPNGCYNGHTFWDVEQFIWPNLLLLHPQMAKAAMQYRYDRMGAARNNSVALTHTAGLKYPWESAFTGLAACPFFAQQNEVREIHINGDVSLAMWQVWQATHDIEWLGRIGWPVISGIAEFWASRLTAGPGGNLSNVSLIDAGGPDESNSHALDNTYDLASALHSLQHAVDAAKLLAQAGTKTAIGANWSALIEAIPSSIAYGTSGDGRKIIRCWAEGKDQCNGIGVVMLRYPLNVSRRVLNDAVAAADLDFYATQCKTHATTRNCWVD